MKLNSVYIRLWLMMFLQFILFAVWWVPLAAYLTNLGTSEFQKALILSSMAIGCIVSPVIGGIADRYFAAEKVLAGLNITTSILLLLAGLQSNPDVLFIMLLFAMLAYMPTWGLTSAIAMTHSPSEQFPRIRLAGSVGWVASGVFSIAFTKIFNTGFDGTNLPLFCGAVLAFIAALVNLTLPSTPPLAKGQKVSVIQALGLQTLSLMKNKNFAIFILASFLAFIPFALYWSYLSQFLQDIGYKYITITMNWGQLAEILTLFFVPVIIQKLGIRFTMILGLLALFLRYVAFYFGSTAGMDWLFFAAILVHGIIYGFFSVGGQIYINKVAPSELKAQAQGFIFLVTFGLGIIVGNFINAWLIGFFTVTNEMGASHIQWDKIFAVTSGMSLFVLLFFSLLFNYKKEFYERVPAGD
jgi:nucleoside transporter